MFDFDGKEALTMTVGGAGMAFVVLILLATFVAIMGWVVRKRSAAQVQEEPAASQQAELAAAIAVSVAIAADESQREVPRAGVQVAGMGRANGWAVRGRQDIMNSRQRPVPR